MPRFSLGLVFARIGLILFVSVIKSEGQKRSPVLMEFDFHRNFAPQRLLTARSGAYLGWGAWCYAPPLGRQDSIISIELYAKLWHAPSLFVTWAEGLSTQTVGEDLFLAFT